MTLLVGRQWWGAGARCRLVYIKAQLMPLPLSVSCFSIIQIGFTFLVPAHSGSTGKKAVKRACVSTASVAARSTLRVLYAVLHARELYASLNVVVCVYVRLFVMNVGIAKRRNRSRRCPWTDMRGAKEQSRHVRWGQISRTKVFSFESHHRKYRRYTYSRPTAPLGH